MTELAPGTTAWIYALRRALIEHGLLKTPSRLRLKKAWPYREKSLFLLQSETGVESIQWAAWETSTDSRHKGIFVESVGLELTCLSEDPRLKHLPEFLQHPLGADTSAHDIKVVSYKPGRRCAVQAQSPQGEFIAKTYRPVDYSRAVANYDALKRTVADRILSPHLQIDSQATLVWHRDPAPSLRDLLNSPGSVEALRRTGAVIAALHQGHCDIDHTHTRLAELETLGKWVMLVERWDPSFAAQLWSGYRRLKSWTQELPNSGLVCCHRDLHDGQLLVTKGWIRLIDMDTLAWAEPELDLGNLVAHLALSPLVNFPQLLKAGERAFLAAYGSNGGRWNELVLRWYLASAYLRMAAVHRFRPSGGEESAQYLARCGLTMEIQPRTQMKG